MALKIRRFNSPQEFNVLVNGGLISKEFGERGVAGLVDLQLTFDNPAGNCTFTDGSDNSLPGHLSLQEIKSQLEAAVTGLTVTIMGKRIAFEATTAVVMGNEDEASKSLLGFPNNGATVSGTKYNAPGGSAPALVSVHPAQNGSSLILAVMNE